MNALFADVLSMRSFSRVLLNVLLAALPLLSQSSASLTKEQATILEAAQKAALQAVNFSQGDAEALKCARRNFTPEAWDDFMKHMTGFVDKNGAPTFTSRFEPTGNPVLVGQENGVIHFKLRGTLTQTQGKVSRTTYPNLEVDVKASGDPPKISHFEQIYHLN